MLKLIKPNKDTQIYLFVRSASNIVDKQTDRIIIIPPIVGVPTFVKWDSGPSMRIGCPCFCNLCRNLMILGPIIKLKLKLIRIARLLRKVM
jgi:hypothetical protein